VWQPILAAGGLSGRRCRARPAEIRGASHDASFHGVVLNVSFYPMQLLTGADEVIVTFILPKCFCVKSQYLVGGMRSEAFQRSEPLSIYDPRRNQNVNMIRHYDEGVQVVPMEFQIASPNGRYDDVRNLGELQKTRPRGRPVQHSIHRDERLPRSQR